MRIANATIAAKNGSPFRKAPLVPRCVFASLSCASCRSALAAKMHWRVKNNPSLFFCFALRLNFNGKTLDLFFLRFQLSL